MQSPASVIARRLAQNVEAVCRHYLSNGRRDGHYWRVGDVFNTPGQSLYVRLKGPDNGPHAAGKWTDAATGEHGDLLDLIRLARNCARLKDALDEARGFLNETPVPPARPAVAPSNSRDAVDAARRLWASALPFKGTLTERYLAGRKLSPPPEAPLRFHPRCYLRLTDHGPPDARPALLARISDLNGKFMGVQRTWLSADGMKADVPDPRRILGRIQHHAVFIGEVREELAVGEGLETMLAVQELFPELPVAAALSAVNLAQFAVPTSVKRLYVAADNDLPGWRAAARLIVEVRPGVEVKLLLPGAKDWNEELMADKPGALALLRSQLHHADCQ